MDDIKKTALAILEILLKRSKKKALRDGTTAYLLDKQDTKFLYTIFSDKEAGGGIAWLEEQGAIELFTEFGDFWVQGITEAGRALYYKLKEWLSPSDEDGRKLVITLHGIRTFAPWQKELADELGRAGFESKTLDYGFFGALKLMLPWKRRAQVRWFLGKYTEIKNAHPYTTPCIIAHSFGTYLIAQSLEQYSLKFDQIILCGSIIPRDYDWNALFTLGQVKRVLNECAKKDIVVKAAPFFIRDAGPSGAHGFEQQCNQFLCQRFVSKFRHSDYLHSLNFTESWIPFLKGGPAPSNRPPLNRKLNWKFWLTVIAFFLLFSIITYWLAHNYGVGLFSRGKHNNDNHNGLNKKEPSESDLNKLEDTLKSLLDLEAGQGPMFRLLRRHCERGQSTPTDQLHTKATFILSEVRNIQTLMSPDYPSDFALKNFGTLRQLKLDLEARAEILEPIVSMKAGATGDPKTFCEMANAYKSLHLRLSTLEEDYHQYLMQHLED